MSTKWF